MSQTTIQKDASIRKGSVRVLVGDDFLSLVDIGALRNAKYAQLVENQDIEFDNVDPKKKFVKGKRCQITFDLCEINLSNLAVLDGGIMNLTTTPGSLVAGATQLVVSGAWSYATFILIEHQNGDGSPVVVNSVTGATDGVLTEDVDYIVATDENGKTGILVPTPSSASSVTTEGQNLTIDYDYTPNASKKITFTDSGNKTLKCMRIINTDENNKTFKIDIEDGTNFAPSSITFASDQAADVAVLPIDFQGNVVEWVDEQNID